MVYIPLCCFRSTIFFSSDFISQLTLFLIVPVLLSIHPVLCSETVGRFHTPEASSRRVTASTSCNSWKSRNLKWDESAGLDFWKSGIDSYISLRVIYSVVQSQIDKKTTLLFVIRLSGIHSKNQMPWWMTIWRNEKIQLLFLRPLKIEKTKTAIASYNIQDNIELEETT